MDDKKSTAPPPLAVGILGAVIMPHKIYPHTAVVRALCEAKFNNAIESAGTLGVAFFHHVRQVPRAAFASLTKGLVGLDGPSGFHLPRIPRGSCGLVKPERYREKNI